jgi:predicted ATPase/DNA-binding SARP family transcriptional activator/Tfp pilus assembly protein PilF
MQHETWEFLLLGGLQVRQGDRTALRSPTRKTASLLAYLAYYVDQPHSRDEIITIFWPGHPLDAGRNNLRVTLNALRRLLEPEPASAHIVLLADRTTVQLNPQLCATDVARFERLLKTAENVEEVAERAGVLMQAIALYRGPLLPEFEVEWVTTERWRLAEAHQAALRRLIRCLAEQQAYEQALTYARLAVVLDPMREEAHLDLMRLYAAAGQPSLALRQYQELECVLRQELNAAPSATARQLAEQLIRLLGHESGAREQPRTAASPPAVHQASIPDPRSSTIERPPVPAGNLPYPLTRFFGREHEVARLSALVSGIRNVSVGGQLITLTGPGGAGKTRLAQEAARQWRPAFPGGIWFVPLADLSDPSLIPMAIADVLGLPRSANRDPVEQIIARIASLPTVLILDNFEQLTEMGSELLSVLLEGAPKLVCLVTSRRATCVSGEHEFPVEPLPISHSVQLFLDRARSISPDFPMTPRNTEAVQTLCTRLEGIPLAIELAAARIRVLTPTQMLEYLDHRFELLVNHRTNKNARHRSLRATLDGSFYLLTPPQRRFLSRLSSFQGGWSLAAAAEVCAEPNALTLLEQLCMDSLIRTDNSGGETRFRMLETVREYAAERLSQNERLELARRHAEWALDLAARADAQLHGPEQATWVARLESEHDNLRAALDWCASERGDPRIGLRIGEQLWRFWNLRGYGREGYARLQTALAQTAQDGDTEDRANALNGAGMLIWRMGGYDEARALLMECLRIHRAIGNRARQAAALNNLGIVAWSLGEMDEARAAHQESLRLKRELGDRWGVSSSLNNLGAVARDSGDYEAAAAAFQESLALCRELQDKTGIAFALNNLGNMFFAVGEWQRAKDHYEQSLALKRELGEQHSITVTLGNLGCVAFRQRDFALCRSYLEECLRLYREQNAPRYIASTLNDLGRCAIATGDLNRAHELFSECLRLRQELQNGPECWVVLESFARLATAKGDWRHAAQLYSLVETLRREAKGTREPADQPDCDQDLAALRAALGKADFAACWEAGGALSLAQGVELARQI